MKANDPEFSFAFAARNLTYCEVTGRFTRVRSHGARRPGRYAESLTAFGYYRVNVGSRYVFAHRLAWFWHHGAWPQGEVDHINGVKTDNRIVNLRVISHVENTINIYRPSKNNKSGYRGVSWHKAKKKYEAKLSVNGKQIVVGRFDSANEASAAYIKQKTLLFSKLNAAVWR